MFFANCSRTSWDSPFKLKTDICLKSREKTLSLPPSRSRSPLLSRTLPDWSVRDPSPWSLLISSCVSVCHLLPHLAACNSFSRASSSDLYILSFCFSILSSRDECISMESLVFSTTSSVFLLIGLIRSIMTRDSTMSGYVAANKEALAAPIECPISPNFSMWRWFATLRM